MAVSTGAAILGAGALTAGTGLLGGYMANQSAQAGADNAREANRRSVELNTNKSIINSGLMSPYVGVGYNALADIYGYSKTGSGSSQKGPKGSIGVPTLVKTGSSWDSPTTVGYDYYTKTGTGVDPTGGAGKYKTALEGFNQNFTFNPDDPAYKYQMTEAEKSINRSLAARGLYDSRVGINALSDADRAITASEVDKQYNRGYSNLNDLYNMSMQMGSVDYNKLLDLVKVGTGAGATAGGLGNQSANALTSSYNQVANTSNLNAANNASLWSGLGNIPANALGAYAAYRSIGTPTAGNAIPYMPAA